MGWKAEAMFIIRPRRKGLFEEKKETTHKPHDFEEFPSYLFHSGDFRLCHQIETPFSEQ